MSSMLRRWAIVIPLAVIASFALYAPVASATPAAAPPRVNITSPADGALINDRTPAITFNVNQDSKFECRIDSDAFTPCGDTGGGPQGIAITIHCTITYPPFRITCTITYPPFKITCEIVISLSLAEGRHTFEVRAVDEAGKKSSASSTFTVQTAGTPAG